MLSSCCSPDLFMTFSLLHSRMTGSIRCGSSLLYGSRSSHSTRRLRGVAVHAGPLTMLNGDMCLSWFIGRYSRHLYGALRLHSARLPCFKFPTLCRLAFTGSYRGLTFCDSPERACVRGSRDHRPTLGLPTYLPFFHSPPFPSPTHRHHTTSPARRCVVVNVDDALIPLIWWDGALRPPLCLLPALHVRMYVVNPPCFVSRTPRNTSMLSSRCGRASGTDIHTTVPALPVHCCDP